MVLFYDHVMLKEPELFAPRAKPKNNISLVDGDFESFLVLGKNGISNYLDLVANLINGSLAGAGAVSQFVEKNDWINPSTPTNAIANSIGPFPTGYPFSTFIHGRPLNNTEVNLELAYADDTVNNRFIFTQLRDTGEIRTGLHDGTNFHALSSSSTYDIGEDVCIVAMYPSTNKSSWRIYANGKRVDSGTTGTAGFPTGLNRTGIGVLPRLTDIYYPGRYRSCGLIQGGISEDKARNISQNPYAFIAPIG